jgi:carbamoyltransferase
MGQHPRRPSSCHELAMPNVLGFAPGHNATVCLMRDGELAFCQSEERLSRVKNHLGLPSRTMEHLHAHVIRPEEVDVSVINAQTFVGYYAILKGGVLRSHDPGYYLKPEQIPSDEAMKPLEDPVALEAAVQEAQRQARQFEGDAALSREAWRYFAAAAGVTPERLLAQGHHLCHALSTLPFLPEGIDEPTLVLTLDGSGDFLCATVNLYDRTGFRVLDQTPDTASIGRVYELVTGLLGMKIGEHEYKVMGLAPYSKPEHYRGLIDRFREIVRVDEDGQWRTSAPLRELALHKLHKMLHLQRFDNVAGAVQAYVEEEVLAWVRFWLRRTGARSLACAGGVFMNVKLNKALAELPEVDWLTVTPSAADESCAIGAAVAGHMHQAPGTPVKPTRHIYLGQDVDDWEIGEALAAMGIAELAVIERPADPEDRIAALLAEGEVVARCVGPMEFGARSLGNRSILADPSKPDVVMLINEAIKNRDFWMPFAPSVLAEEAHRYLINPKGLVSPFMMIGFDTTDEGRRALAAAMHRYDFTVRPQFVAWDANPRYHHLISRFRDRTGIGAVLNTSFNIHGEPVVCSPRDALSAFLRSGLRHVGLGGYVISKRAAA